MKSYLILRFIAGTILIPEPYDNEQCALLAKKYDEPSTVRAICIPAPVDINKSTIKKDCGGTFEVCPDGISVCYIERACK